MLLLIYYLKFYLTVILIIISRFVPQFIFYLHCAHTYPLYDVLRIITYCMYSALSIWLNVKLDKNKNIHAANEKSERWTIIYGFPKLPLLF